jgi:predicted alpha/beta hydrolase family esterase
MAPGTKESLLDSTGSFVDRMLVVASRGDLVCPFEYVRELCDTWKIRRSHFLTGGHWLVFNREERSRAWYSFLADMGYSGMGE